MRLLSVNVGHPRDVAFQDRVIRTGIFKVPAAGPVWLGRTNLVGDSQADRRVHGGEDKAVYVYPYEHYAFWVGANGNNNYSPGQFGENFTTVGMYEDDICIGDVFKIGDARVQVSQPRTPCFKLGIRMGDDQFPARFAAAARTGFYLRVLEEGNVTAGNTIERVERIANSMTVRAIFDLRHVRHGAREEYAQAAQIAGLSISWRAAFKQRVVENE
ncbi:MAG: MOSC domain-containing protein [Sulfuricaulis sp.]